MASSVSEIAKSITSAQASVSAPAVESTGDRFYSPLVRNIADKENVSQAELDALPGSGQNGRVTKNDILAYLQQRDGEKSVDIPAQAKPVTTTSLVGSRIAWSCSAVSPLK